MSRSTPSTLCLSTRSAPGTLFLNAQSSQGTQIKLYEFLKHSCTQIKSTWSAQTKSTFSNSISFPCPQKGITSVLQILLLLLGLYRYTNSLEQSQLIQSSSTTQIDRPIKLCQPQQYLFLKIYICIFKIVPFLDQTVFHAK